MPKQDPELEQDNLLAIEDDFEVDAVLNEHAMDALTFLNEKIADDPRVPEGEQAYIMWQIMTAVLFNVLMHIAENAEIDPRELVEKTKENLMEAIEAMEGCCGGGEHHHH